MAETAVMYTEDDIKRGLDLLKLVPAPGKQLKLLESHTDSDVNTDTADEDTALNVLIGFIFLRNVL